MRLNHDEKVVMYQGEKFELTPTEFNLLVYLVANYPDWCAKNSIQEYLWGKVRGSYDPVVNYVSRLRDTIGDEIIQTSRFKAQIAYRATEGLDE